MRWLDKENEMSHETMKERHDRYQRNCITLSKKCRALEEALRMYHEAWNGCEGDWKAAMRRASKVADQALSNKEVDRDE